MHKILNYSTLLARDGSPAIVLFIEFRLELFDVNFSSVSLFVRVLEIQKSCAQE